MRIVRSAYSCGLPCRATEHGQKAGPWGAKPEGEGKESLSDNERASPSASESDSASLH